MEIVEQHLDTSGDIIVLYQKLNWKNGALGIWFTKYLPPAQDLKRGPEDVERRRKQMLDPGFAASLHRTIEKKDQEISNWSQQLRYNPREIELQSNIAKAQHDIKVTQDSLVRIRDGNYHLK